MNQSTINNVFKKTDESYLKWLFPQNKKSLTTGLVLMFVTVSMISLVDVFYHSDLFGYPTRAAAIAAGGKTFEFDNFFRLIFAPIFNLLTIFLARSAWNNSIKKQEIIVAFVLLVNILSFLFTGIFNDYYTAAQGFTYEVLVLILFCQMLFGISFRVSFFYNLLLVLVTIA